MLRYCPQFQHCHVWDCFNNLTLNEDLFDGLYLPCNEPMAFGVVKFAGSQLEPLLCCKIPLFLCHALFPLLEMTYLALPYPEIIDVRAEITFLLDIHGSNLNTGNFV